MVCLFTPVVHFLGSGFNRLYSPRYRHTLTQLIPNVSSTFDIYLVSLQIHLFLGSMGNEV